MAGRSSKFNNRGWSGGFTSDTAGGGGGGGSPLILTTAYVTFAALDAALIAAGAGAMGALFNAAGTAIIGIWQYDGTDSHLVGPLDLTVADGTEFIAGTDYVLRNITAVWETPGAGGGLTLSGSGLIEWPCLGLKDGYPEHKAKAYCTFVGGTLTNAQRLGAGSSSLSGDAFFCGGAWYFFSSSLWVITDMWGVPSTMTSLSYTANTSSNQRIATGAVPLPAEIWLDCSAGGRDGIDTLGNAWSRLTRDDTGNPGNAGAVAKNTTAFLKPMATDHRFCVYYDDAGNGDSSLRLRKLYWDGVRP